MTRWIFLVAAVLALGWTALWVVSAWTLKSEVADWFEERRTQGWTADYTDLTVRGFPSRVDVTLSDVTLLDPQRSTGWEGEFFQVLGLSYKPGHNILVWPDAWSVTLNGRGYAVESAGLLASVIHDSSGTVLRFNAEADFLNIDGPRSDLAFAVLRTGVQRVPGTAGLYRLGFHADAIAGPPGNLSPAGRRAEGLDVQLEALFDLDWTLSNALTGPRPQPKRLDLRLADYKQGGLELNLAGRIDVDEQGRGDGDVTLRAVNWRDMLEQARIAGQIPDRLAGTLESGLSLAASLKGNPKTLDLPLTFDKGEVSLGLIPLGTGPRFQLP